MDASTDVWSLAITVLEAVIGDRHIQGLVDAGVSVCGPSDPECEEASLCEIALNDQENWPQNLDLIIKHFREALQVRTLPHLQFGSLIFALRNLTTQNITNSVVKMALM